MARKRHTPEEIIGKLRAVEVELAKGRSAQQACRKLGMTEQTYYSLRVRQECSRGLFAGCPASPASIPTR